MNNHSSFTRLACCFLLMCGGMSLALPAFAGDVLVTRYFSGLWDQPKQESQGIVLNIIDQEEDGNPKAVAYWFTYGDDLETAWYMAIGHVEGNQVIMTLYSAAGVAFMEDEAPDVSPVDVAGDLMMTFTNCNHGTASYSMTNGEEEAGEFDIKRLAGLYIGRCSGGIADNVPGGGKPLMLEVDLLPAAEDGTGSGKAKYWERSDRFDFIVSAEGIADGDYAIVVCGEPEGTLTVSGGEGSTHFRSSTEADDGDDDADENDDKELLTFVPKGCPVDLTMGGSVVLTSGDKVLAEKETGHGKDKAKDKTKVEVDLESTGVIEGAEGEAEYETGTDEAEFEVEIENVPAGNYDLYVGGNMEGVITVDEDGGKGKLNFSDPQKGDRELLDFVPWGMLIEVKQDGTTILQVEFPPE